MPCDYSKYPPNWKSEIRPRIMRRAGEVRNDAGDIVTHARCENCGVENHVIGWRVMGVFITPEQFGRDYFEPGFESTLCAIVGKKKPYKIVLTIAHLDHDKENWNVKDERLAALCQGCHLNYDRARHSQHAADNRAKKKKQQRLF